MYQIMIIYMYIHILISRNTWHGYGMVIRNLILYTSSAYVFGVGPVRMRCIYSPGCFTLFVFDRVGRAKRVVRDVGSLSVSG